MVAPHPQRIHPRPEAALPMSEPTVPEITPAELVRAIEAGDPLQLVDVRRPEAVSQGRIDLLPPERFVNIVGSQLRARPDLDGTGIAPTLRTVAVCGHGNSSKQATEHLRALGVDAFSLRGGMAAWMNLVVERAVPAPRGLDHLLQFDRIGKGSLAYLLVRGGEALVVDPPRDTTPLTAAAARLGARITAVADTHVHADYVSGATALSRALGVPYHLHPADNAYPYDGTPGRLAIQPLAEGATIRVGDCAVVAEHTPGHTEGSTCFRVGDAAMLTGDFVFVDSLGRPDLAGRAGDWWELLWTSVERARREWPAGLVVLPAHYSSERERQPDRSVREAFGVLLGSNPALRILEREAFRAWATAKASFPEAYRTIKAVNVLLQGVTDAEAEVLEVGRNECAVTRPVQ